MNYNFGQVGSGARNTAEHGGYNGGMLAGRGVVQAAEGNTGRSGGAEGRLIERKRKRTAAEAGSDGQETARRKLHSDERPCQDIIAEVWGLVGGFLDTYGRKTLKAVNKASYRGVLNASTKRIFSDNEDLLRFLYVQVQAQKGQTPTQEEERIEEIIQACSVLTSEDVRRLLNADTIKNSLYIWGEEIMRFKDAPGLLKAIMGSLHRLELDAIPKRADLARILTNALQGNHSIRELYDHSPTEGSLLTLIWGNMQELRHLSCNHTAPADMPGIANIIANRELEALNISLPADNMSNDGFSPIIQALHGKQFKKLCFGGRKLARYNLERLLDALQGMSTLEELNLSGAVMTPENVAQLAKVVANNKELKILSLPGCGLYVGQNTQTFSPHPHENRHLTNMQTEFAMLCKAMEGSKIKTLILSNNPLGSEGALLLAESIATMQLDQLHLNRCDITRDHESGLQVIPFRAQHYKNGLKGLRAILQSIQAHAPRTLALSNNTLGNLGTIEVVNAVPGSRIRILELWNNDIDFMGTMYIASKIPELGNISLNLSRNPLFTPRGYSGSYDRAVEELARAIESTACRLYELTINGANTDNPAILRLLQAVETQQNLQVVMDRPRDAEATAYLPSIQEAVMRINSQNGLAEGRLNLY